MSNSRQFPFILQGDAVSAVIDIIKNNTPELNPYTFTISSGLKGYTKGDLWILVQLAGGSYKFLHTKRTRVDITVYAEVGPDSTGRANDVASIIQASLFAWQGGYTGHGVYFHSLQIETDIFEAYDKDEDPCRFVQSLRFLLLPANQPLS